ncbi:HTH-type transcriptional regulator Ptr2 [Candidatus Anstonella stagnisolia]|nr:HTH-type transcriptional regulator Ptr2 [Candidatus Anstonella stagnisolia]
MGEDLDNIDRRIMYELYVNSRMPLSALAKKMRMSKQRLNYRIQKLYREGSIKAFITMIDRAKLRYTFDMFCYEISPYSELQEKTIFKKLLALNPSMLFKCDGKWNLMIGFVIPNVYELAEKQQQVHFLLRGHMVNEFHFLHMKSLRFRMPLSDEEIRAPIFSIGIQSQPVILDDKDTKILSALSINARASYLELSKKLKMPPETIRYRIKQLEKSRVIQGYSISVDPNLYGAHHYRIYVKLNVPDSKTFDSVLSYVSTMPTVTRVVTMVGEYNFFYDAVVSGGSELRKIKEHIAHKFFKYLVEQEPIRIYEEYRYSHFPAI